MWRANLRPGGGDCREGGAPYARLAAQLLGALAEGVPLRLALPPLAAAWSHAAQAASAPPPPPPPAAAAPRRRPRAGGAAADALPGSAAGACGALQGFFREAVAASGRKALQGALAPSAAFLLAALGHREAAFLALEDGAPGGVGAAAEEEDEAAAAAVEGEVVMRRPRPRRWRGGW